MKLVSENNYKQNLWMWVTMIYSLFKFVFVFLRGYTDMATENLLFWKLWVGLHNKSSFRTKM